jgi:predicted aspartyl protease
LGKISGLTRKERRNNAKIEIKTTKKKNKNFQKTPTATSIGSKIKTIHKEKKKQLEKQQASQAQKEDKTYIGNSPVRTDILLNDIPTRAIIDSGSSLNIISQEIFSKLQRVDPTLELEPNPTIIHGLSGVSTNVGEVTLRIQIGSVETKVAFLVIKKTRVSVLLGVPTLHLLGITLEFATNKLILGEHQQPFTTLDRLDEQVLITPAQRTRIPPRTRCMVLCKGLFPLSDQHANTYLVEEHPGQSLLKDRLLLP